MQTITDYPCFNKGNVNYEEILSGKSKISLVIVMLTIKDSSNFKKRNVDYDRILNEKK